MPKFAFLALFLAACSVAPAHRSEAIDAPDMSPPGVLCGNGNVYCAPDELCYNGNCITICGTHACWQKLQTAWGQCGG